MKGFLYDILIEPFNDAGLMGVIIGVLLWIVIIALVLSISYFALWIIDSSFLPIKEEVGVVTNCYIFPAYTQTTFVTIGSVVSPITTYISESYEVTIEINGLSDNVSLSQSDWLKIKVGDKFLCQYTSGRVLDTIYIKSFSE